MPFLSNRKFLMSVSLHVCVPQFLNSDEKLFLTLKCACMDGKACANSTLTVFPFNVNFSFADTRILKGHSNTNAMLYMFHIHRFDWLTHGELV